MSDAAPQAPQANDRHRKELAAALLIALLALYRRRTRQTLDTLGLTTAPVVVSASTMAWLTAFANDRAAKAQRGINLRLGQAVTELPDGAAANIRGGASPGTIRDAGLQRHLAGAVSHLHRDSSGTG